jgi:hypothetical protein
MNRNARKQHCMQNYGDIPRCQYFINSLAETKFEPSNWLFQNL